MPPRRISRSPLIDIQSPIIDYENEENMTIEYFNNHSIDIINNIELKRDIYSELLNEILKNSKSTKEKLDMYYDNLQWYHSIVQTSVIIVSTGSTFVQSVLDKEKFERLLSFITISVSTYSGLILSLAKFFKLDEKKENVHNLRERFVELHNRINYQDDLLKLWDKDKNRNDFTFDKMNRWKNIMDDVEKEYLNIIDIKKNLLMEFEKLIDSLVQQKYTTKHKKCKDKEKKCNNSYA